MSKLVETIASAIVLGIHNKDNENMEYMVRDVLSKLDRVEIKVFREDDTVKLPTYGKDSDACMDVYVHHVENKPDGRIVYHTGLHFRLPEDYEMEIRPRSSNTKTHAVMQNAPGTLDEGYTGELMIVHRRIDKYDDPEYQVGDRVAQILIRHRERIIWQEVTTQEELGTTERGAGGFGSTGK
jgi:dUTP pyrophosphatase